MHTIDCYLTIAEKHGEESEPDHEVGDLQDFLRAMWDILTPTQRWEYANAERVREIIENTGIDTAALPECAAPPDATPWCEQCRSYHGTNAGHITRTE